ncbi:hypothetical protein C8A00DRAFT_15586 [Chaetomidium leptoderma]|uniref:Uncharacterized protein n=1 Tax=Chaetomidium leptoderma TaxID=669021 RepID=A0AAN6ZY57_9PEZI|nr:hypothetical protein C8A00DRAFT_15586 [Chaetomidium leptoderma]
MALECFADSSGAWPHDFDAWKQSYDIDQTAGLHRMATRHLEGHLRYKAAAELERFNLSDMAVADREVPSTELASPPGRLHPRPKLTKAQFAEAGLDMAYWDMTEYLWTLENLKKDLHPALGRSSRFLMICAGLKAIELFISPSLECVIAGYSVLTVLTAYHAGFSAAYFLALRLVSRCRRQTEEMRAKVGNKSVCEDDVRSWGGFVYRATNWVAERRDFQRQLFNGDIGYWVVDLIISWTSI